MKGKFTKIMMPFLCAIMTVSSILCAEEIVEKKHAAVGERAVSADQRMAQRRSRAVAIQKAEKAENINAAKLAKGMRPAAVKSLAAKSVYMTTHPAAYQHPVSIDSYGGSMELMDGSIWAINPNDAYKTMDWYTTDLVVITLNHKWFSSYDFRITNQTTGSSVQADLYLGPFDPAYGSPYTHWILGVDYYYNEVYLEDGSVWSMSGFDRSIVDSWIAGDTVIIGVNDGWLAGSNPNILINVNMLNFAAGLCNY